MYKILITILFLTLVTEGFGQIIFVHDTTGFSDYRWKNKKLLSQYRHMVFGDDGNMGKKLFTVHDTGGSFNKIYLLNDKGEVISTDFVPAHFFSPNDNFLVVGGSSLLLPDSFNPYGAIDIGQALFVGAINRFISEIKNNKQTR